MEIVKSSNIMESFGLVSVEKGFFTEIDELELVDIIGGACGAGGCSTKGAPTPTPNCTQCYQSVYYPGCFNCYNSPYFPIKIRLW